MECGGLAESGWLGVVDFALGLAGRNLAARAIKVPGVGVDRSEPTLRAREDESFASAYQRRVAGHLRRMNRAPRLLEATDGAPPMWAYSPASRGRVSEVGERADPA